MFFHADKVFSFNVIVTQQSPDIAQGVDARKAKVKRPRSMGRGDQGLMFVTRATKRRTDARADHVRASSRSRADEGSEERKVPWFRPTEVAGLVVYENGKSRFPFPTSSFHAARGQRSMGAK